MSEFNEPAYPAPSKTGYSYHPGMTIRQRYVMAAMQGICSIYPRWSRKDIADKAIEVADAVLRRERETR